MNMGSQPKPRYARGSAQRRCKASYKSGKEQMRTGWEPAIADPPGVSWW